MFDNIITICTGNICRSPLAEALLHRELGARGKKVQSAGIAALVGHPADDLAREVARDNGFDIGAHRARQLTRELIAANDVVLVLDETHEHWITQRFPEFRGKTFKLGKWHGNRNIEDPYRRPKAHFEQALKEIREDVAAWAAKLA